MEEEEEYGRDMGTVISQLLVGAVPVMVFLAFWDDVEVLRRMPAAALPRWRRTTLGIGVSALLCGAGADLTGLVTQFVVQRGAVQVKHGVLPLPTPAYADVAVIGTWIGSALIAAGIAATRRNAARFGCLLRHPSRRWRPSDPEAAPAPIRSFRGGMRLGSANWTWPLVRLSVFDDRLQLGPSLPVLSVVVPTAKFRFDELTEVQAIGRSMWTGIRLESATGDRAVFWVSSARPRVFDVLGSLDVPCHDDPVPYRSWMAEAARA